MKNQNTKKIIIITALLSCVALTQYPAFGAKAISPTARVLIRSMIFEPSVEHCVETSSNATLRTSSGKINFSMESKVLTTDNIRVWMNETAELCPDGCTVLKADVERVILPLISSKSILSKSPAIRTIILDPGHGGVDSGALGRTGKKEKTLVLDIAKRTKIHLEKAGYKVKMTRGADAFVPLKKRTELAKNWDADLFVSIHLNSASNKKAYGLETFVLPAPELTSTLNGKGNKKKCSGNKFDRTSIVIAAKIHLGILKKTKTADRGIKHARFEVLRTAPCPAMLLECGFLSNNKEEKNLMKPEFREAIALGISEGIKSCSAERKKD